MTAAGDRHGPGELLITGAAGFIGRRLTVGAATTGWRVTAVDERRAPTEVEAVARVRRTDFAAPDVLALVRSGRFAAVLHQAAITSTLATDWNQLKSTNVTKSLLLARACAQAGTSFVYASSNSVYGRIHRPEPISEGAVDDRSMCTGPLNLYGRSKLEFDRLMADAEVAAPNWVGLRYTNVFGDGERQKGAMASIISQLLRTAATGGVVRLFADSLNAHRDYVPVEHVVDCVLRILGTPMASGVYNLGSGHAVSFATLLQWCAEFGAGRDVVARLVANPVAAVYQYWTCADMSALHKALDIPGLGLDDIRAAAAALYRGAA